MIHYTRIVLSSVLIQAIYTILFETCPVLEFLSNVFFRRTCILSFYFVVVDCIQITIKKSVIKDTNGAVRGRKLGEDRQYRGRKSGEDRQYRGQKKKGQTMIYTKHYTEK